MALSATRYGVCACSPKSSVVRGAASVRLPFDMYPVVSFSPEYSHPFSEEHINGVQRRPRIPYVLAYRHLHTIVAHACLRLSSPSSPKSDEAAASLRASPSHSQADTGLFGARLYVPYACVMPYDRQQQGHNVCTSISVGYFTLVYGGRETGNIHVDSSSSL